MGQAKVQYGDVIILDIAGKPGVAAVGRDIDDEPHRLQRGTDIVGDIGFVLDDQGAHQSCSTFNTLPVRASISTSMTRPDADNVFTS